MKKLISATALGLTALFLLAACKEETANSSTNNEPPVAELQQAAPPPAPAGTRSRLDDSRFIAAALPVTTLDGRNLSVSFTAYCEKMGDLNHTQTNESGYTEYSAACIDLVKGRIDYLAQNRECFEGNLPAVSPAVRNHEGLPQRPDDKCYDVYPENYAHWTEAMMRRMLEMTMDDDLYTVTKITPAGPR